MAAILHAPLSVSGGTQFDFAGPAPDGSVRRRLADRHTGRHTAGHAVTGSGVDQRQVVQLGTPETVPQPI